MSSKKKSKQQPNVAVINRRFEENCPVDKLIPWDKNPNQGDAGAIYESIEVNGFYGGIVAQESTGKILAGNHRFRAAMQHGLTELPVHWVDVSDAEAIRIAIADNRTSRLGADDPQQLAELLESIRSNQGDLTGTGFDDEALQELLEDLGRGFVGDSDGEGSGDAPPQNPRSEHKVVVNCQGERHQEELLDRFKAEGFDCYALTN